MWLVGTKVEAGEVLPQAKGVLNSSRASTCQEAASKRWRVPMGWTFCFGLWTNRIVKSLLVCGSLPQKPT